MSESNDRQPHDAEAVMTSNWHEEMVWVMKARMWGQPTPMTRGESKDEMRYKMQERAGGLQCDKDNKRTGRQTRDDAVTPSWPNAWSCWHTHMPPDLQWAQKNETSWGQCHEVTGDVMQQQESNEVRQQEDQDTRTGQAVQASASKCMCALSECVYLVSSSPLPFHPWYGMHVHCMCKWKRVPACMWVNAYMSTEAYLYL